MNKMSPQLKNLLENIGHLAYTGGLTRIGCGEYTPDTLRNLIAEIKEMNAKLQPKSKPVPWTLSPWLHIKGNDQFLIMQGDRIVTSMFTIGEADRERFARALTWLNEQGDAV